MFQASNVLLSKRVKFESKSVFFVLASANANGDEQQDIQLKDDNMTSSKENALQKTDQLPMDLNDLIAAVQRLPEKHRQELEQPLNRVVEYTRRRRRILNLIQEALSQLRMDMKYLMFDLEATRRERDAYKNSLDDGT